MSKIKDQMERDHEHEMEQYYSFMEWVCDQQELSEYDDINEVEEDSEESSTSGTSIVHQKALNNIDYNPSIGA